MPPRGGLQAGFGLLPTNLEVLASDGWGLPSFPAPEAPPAAATATFARLMQQARVQRDQQAALARLAQNGAEQPAQPPAAPTPSNGAEHGNDQSAQPPAPPTTGNALLEMLLQHRAGNVPQATVTALPQEGPNPTSALPRPPSEQPARPPAPVTTSNMVECSICCGPPMSRFTKGAINTPCGHCFHRQCLQPWLAQGKEACPTCRGDISCLAQMLALR
jgi:hypothetical protein